MAPGQLKPALALVTSHECCVMSHDAHLPEQVQPALCATVCHAHTQRVRSAYCSIWCSPQDRLLTLACILLSRPLHAGPVQPGAPYTQHCVPLNSACAPAQQAQPPRAACTSLWMPRPWARTRPAWHGRGPMKLFWLLLQPRWEGQRPPTLQLTCPPSPAAWTPALDCSWRRRKRCARLFG